MMNNYTLKSINVAKGRTLDIVAHNLGLKRKFLETDRRLRKRIINFYSVGDNR